jgi:beta-phosphoglucomutase-like phosphatase (HAD superfamily)
LVTNASRATVRPFLQYGLKTELAAQLSHVITSDSGLRQKPAPDLYQQALRRLRLAPYECVAIEDSSIGLRAACAAGIPAVVTVNAQTEGEDFHGASLVLDGLGDPGMPARVLLGHMDESSLSLSTLQRIASQSAPRL